MTHDIYNDNLRAFPVIKPADFEDIPVFGCVPELLRTLKTLCRLEIRFIRTGGTLPLNMIQGITVPVEGGASPGQLVLIPNENSGSSVLPQKKYTELLKNIASLMGEAYRWQQSCRRNEEKIVSLPIGEYCRFSRNSLFDVLKQSAKLLDCCAAALYRLNSSDKTLKMSSSWGLPEERLLDPPRDLHDSLADVEAILGQTVILNEDYLFEVWQPPENFPMAVCLPIITANTIFGTLWLYSERRFDLTEHDLELLEYIAGRVAAEWELSRAQSQITVIKRA